MFSCRKNARARIVRRGTAPCLLAVFDASVPPMIWQMDLEKLANYSLFLREKEGEWDFGVALPQGPFTPVAHFEERSEAETAFAAVRAALLKGEGAFPLLHHVRNLVLIALLAFVLVFFLTPVQAPQTPQAQSQRPRAESNQPQELKPGIPMSADDVLTIPQD